MTTNFTMEDRWQSRFFAGARFLLFAVLFYAFLSLGLWGIAGLQKLIEGFAWQESVNCSLAFLSTLLATFVLALLEKRSIRDYGWGGIQRLRLLSVGLISGTLLISAIVFTLYLVGGLAFSHHLRAAPEALENAFAYGVLFLLVGLSEESLWRGYALVSLSKAISFWPATMALGILFGLSHVSNQHESRAAILSASVIGMVFCYSFRRFGSLWFAVGVHASWNFGQSFVYGVPDSGIIVPGSFLAARVAGPAWLAGGKAGPEGSILMILVIATLILIIRQGVGCQPPPNLPHTPECERPPAAN